jgi:hypothetical protein
MSAMDPNKLVELRRIGFKIRKTCKMCKHGTFFNGSEWGTCAVRTYEHLKHSDAKRHLSVHFAGSCPDLFELSFQVELLGAFAEFLE